MPREHREHLCRQLRRIRSATVQLERELLLDRTAPLTATFTAYSIGDQVHEVEQLLSRLLYESLSS
jgi:hypothetical protein